MRMLVQDVIAYLEQVAPLAYQENYDNAGLVVGTAETPVTGVLVCLDVTEAVLQEAVDRRCNLVVSHHPIVFQPLKRLTGQNHVEICVIQAIKQDLAVYAMHTNLDHVAHGVNHEIAHTLGLHDLSLVCPKPNVLSQLTTFVPRADLESVLHALHHAGAGRIGNYTHCSFVTTGTGAFQPSAEAHPYIGAPHQAENVQEERVEVIFPTHLEKSILNALKEAHPYEEVAYYTHPISNTDAQVGAGMIGMLPDALDSKAFLHHLKAKMHLACIRHTALIDRPIRRVAVCGGAGSHLLQAALGQKADALVTADVRYHDFFAVEGRLLLADIGHYESEIGTKKLIYALLSEKFPNLAITTCSTVSNPIYYF